MTINAAVFASLEDAIDTIAEMILSPSFASALSDEHQQQRVRIPFRVPEHVYTEDIETPDGYPCCELIAVHVRDVVNSTIADLDHEMSVQWTVNGDNEQVMGREIKRLIAATRTIFRDGTLLPNVGGTLRTGDVDFGPVLTARPAENASARYVKSASIELFWQAYLR